MSAGRGAGGRGDPRSGRGKSLRRGRTKEGTEEGRALTGFGAIDGVILSGDLGRLRWEELELARIVIGLGRNRLIVVTYLGVVVVLELERELHQRVGDVSDGLVGEGELVLLFGVVFASCHRAYSSMSFLVRKLLPSIVTVSTWCRTRSRMAEVSVLSLLKICDQYL